MQLEQYGHGGDLRTAADIYGVPVDGWLDFSSNMNPWGPPDIVGELLCDRWRDIVRYPDPAVRTLRGKLSAVYDVPADSILVGNGAAELIELAVRLIQPKETLLARPSFSEYEQAVRKIGGAIRDVPLHADERFRLPPPHGWADDLAAAAERPDRALFLGHPNNPTGQLIPAAALRCLADAGAQLILDEAFIDFVPDERCRSMLQAAAASQRVIVIRSMTKFYAVPGIRLGFLVAHPDRVRQLAALQTQWSVNAFAQLIGEAVLDDDGYAARTRAWLTAARPWLISRLQALGLHVVPSDVNYLLLSLPPAFGRTAAQLQQAMARRGVMIRDASLFTGLDAAYFRIAIRLRHENERLLRELEAVLR